MLQIYLINQTESGFLDLAPDAQLSIESLADAFDDDLTFGEFSLPLDLPFTSKNRRLLGFADRLKNNNPTQNYWVVNVYDDGFPELVNAKMTLLQKSGNFNFPDGKFSVTISGTKGLFGSLILNKKLADIDFGTDISFAETSSRDFATNVMKGVYPGYSHISFCPVAIEGYFDENRPDYINEFLTADTVNGIVVTGSGTDDWEFGRWVSAGTSAASGTSEYIDYRTVPFINFKWLVQKVFASFGFTVSGAFLDNAVFQNLFFFNTWSIDNLSATLHTDSNRTISLRNHVPDMLVLDFLKGIFSFFKVYPTFQAGSVNLSYKNDLLTRSTPIAFTKNIGAEYESSLQENIADGYTLKYTWDSADQYYSDRVKDLTTLTNVGSVNTKADLDTLDIGRAFTIYDYALVKSENLFYRVSDATAIPVTWDCYAENLDSYIKDGGERNPELNMSTLCQYAMLNSTTVLYERQNYVGTRQPGCYINNVGVRVINPFGLRLFYIKKITIDGVKFPVSYNHNTQPDATQVETYSLALNAGFAENFHTAWENLMTNLETVKFSLAGNRRYINDFNNAGLLEINSVHFLTNKVERAIPAESSMDVYLSPI